MWANAQRDGRPAQYRWRPLFNDTNLDGFNNFSYLEMGMNAIC